MSANEFSKLLPIVHGYFEGERREMLLIVFASALAVLMAAALYFSAREGFAKGFLITIAASAILLSGAAAGLLVRDPKLSSTLLTALQDEQAPVAILVERDRLKKVVSNYRSYRFISVAIGMTALLLLALTYQSWIHGVAAGLLILVFAQTVIDRYSEERARGYLASLANASIR